jgi:hypothetical protein
MTITSFWAANERRARADREALVRLAAACRRRHARRPAPTHPATRAA